MYEREESLLCVICMEGKGEGERGMGGRGRYSKVPTLLQEKNLLYKTRQSYPNNLRICQRFFSFIYLFLSLKN